MKDEPLSPSYNRNYTFRINIELDKNIQNLDSLLHII